VHIHKVTAEAFYVLEGTFGFQLGVPQVSVGNTSIKRSSGLSTCFQYSHALGQGSAGEPARTEQRPAEDA
jgi:hypothetical protein